MGGCAGGGGSGLTLLLGGWDGGMVEAYTYERTNGSRSISGIHIIQSTLLVTGHLHPRLILSAAGTLRGVIIIINHHQSLSFLQHPTPNTSPPTMSILPLHLRTYTEPSKTEHARLLFNIPTLESLLAGGVGADKVPVLVKRSGQGKQKGYERDEKQQQQQGVVDTLQGYQEMEISAVLSVEGKDEVYVSFLSLADDEEQEGPSVLTGGQLSSGLGF